MVLFFFLAFFSWWTWFFDCWGMFEAQEAAEEDGDQQTTKDEANTATFTKCMKDKTICDAIEKDGDNELPNYDYSEYPEKYKEFKATAQAFVNGLSDNIITDFIKITEEKTGDVISVKEAQKLLYKQKRREEFDKWRWGEDLNKFNFFKKKCTGRERKENGIFSFDNIKKFFKDMKPGGNKE